jgi:hypothetical protein
MGSAHAHQATGIFFLDEKPIAFPPRIKLSNGTIGQGNGEDLAEI